MADGALLMKNPAQVMAREEPAAPDDRAGSFAGTCEILTDIRTAAEICPARRYEWHAGAKITGMAMDLRPDMAFTRRPF